MPHNAPTVIMHNGVLGRAAALLCAAAAAAAGGAPLPPDRCFCDGRAHSTYGAACSGQPRLDCGFNAEDSYPDFHDTLRAVAQLPYVRALSLTWGGYAGPQGGGDLSDADWTALGALFGAEPLASQLTDIGLLDQRWGSQTEGATLSSEGLAGLARGLANATALEALSLDLRSNTGLGRIGGCAGAAAPAARAGPAPFFPVGLATLGAALGQLPRVSRLELNFDTPAGAYRLCDADARGFAQGLQRMDQLRNLSLGLNGHDIGDDGAAALGAALGARPALRAANLRLRGSAVSPAGAARLAAGLANASALRSLALDLSGARAGVCSVGNTAVGAAIGRLARLENVWLHLDDVGNGSGGRGGPCGCGSTACGGQAGGPCNDYAGIAAGLQALRSLKTVRIDLHCHGCEGLPGDCVDCSAYPRSNLCNCWEDQEPGCSYGDRGNGYSGGN